MEIFVSKSAGFCFGVQRAIEKANSTVSENGKNLTLGPIIHNEQVVNDLKSKGIMVAKTIDEINDGDRVIIRSHGVSREEYDRLTEKKVEIVDATCPYVKYIHNIVDEKFKLGYKVVIVGDSSHPEVKGINGWCNNTAIIINSDEDIEKIDKNLGKICIVGQTTFNQEKWYRLSCSLVKLAKEILIFNTICNATELRQSEAEELSKKVDVMIVIGGRESSNTRKLYEISKKNCEKTFFVERAEELDLSTLNGAQSIGITAGASTPDYAINAVINMIKNLEGAKLKEIKEEKMEQIVTHEENQNDLEKYLSSFNEIYEGSVVDGKIIHVTNKEVFVDINYKADGIVPMEEISYEPINLKEKFIIGDSIRVQVLKKNDGEGNVLLSRKALEKEEFYDKLRGYKDEGKIIEVTINEVNAGGFAALYNGVKVFLPFSLSGIGRDDDKNAYIGKKLQAKIFEVKDKKNGIELVISRKEMLREERQNKAKETIEKLEVGEVYRGKVKSMIDSGAFVTIDGIDVFVPISEVSWRRINKVKDVLSEGQSVNIILINKKEEELKASGSIKRIEKQPFDAFVEKNFVDDIVNGKVVRFADFGAFVELEFGVDGLIHISNIADRRINRPQEVLKIGEEIKVKIINIDTEKRKIGLSLKDVE